MFIFLYILYIHTIIIIIIMKMYIYIYICIRRHVQRVHNFGRILPREMSYDFGRTSCSIIVIVKAMR